MKELNMKGGEDNMALKKRINRIKAAAAPRKPIIVTNTNDNGPGSLREAIRTAISGDTIVFSETILPGIIRLTSGPITIDKTLTINGPGTESLTVSGEYSTRIFNTVSGVVEIRNISIINGFDNLATAGGAIQNFTTLNVKNCLFSNNSSPSAFGGAIANGTIANPTRGIITIENSTFSSNQASFSGAIGNFSGTVNISNSNLFNNSAANNGGAFANDDTASIINCTFSNNSAGNNGGAFANDGIATISNSIFSMNIASNNGGAIANIFSGKIDITNSEFSNNIASNRGGGIANVNNGTINVTRSIFSNNVASQDGAIANIDAGTVNQTKCTFINNIP